MFLNIFFFVSILNSVVGVLCSATVNEVLAMRKPLGIHYWQGTISGVEVITIIKNRSQQKPEGAAVPQLQPPPCPLSRLYGPTS